MLNFRLCMKSYWPDSNRRPFVCPKNHQIFGDPEEGTTIPYG